MKVLIAYEFSGRIRDAFLDLGHHAVSADILPTESTRHGATHFQGDLIGNRPDMPDIRYLFQQRWDLMIAHPMCTYLTNSGVRWLHTQPERWDKMLAGVRDFKICMKANADYIVIENPIMHRYAREEICSDWPVQYVQPWMFGDLETKATGLHLSPGLKPIVPEIAKKPEGVKASVHTASPGVNRWKERSRTFPGVARALAEQLSAQIEALGEAA